MNREPMRADMRALYDQYPDLEIVETEGRHRLQVRRSVLRLAPKRSVGAEIGVFTGIFSEVLMEVTEPNRLYLVDPWDQLHGSSFPSWGQHTAWRSLSTKAALAAASYRAEFHKPECEVVKEFSDKWLMQFSEPFLDWVYLDAKHTYDYTYRTLDLLRDRLRSGGVVLGDDCWIGEGHQYAETFHAVRDFLDQSGFVLIHLDQNGQWAITRRENTMEARTRAQQHR
jgi:hypothetical protein